MPKVATIASVTKLSVGQRGRKAERWDREAHVIPFGQAIDISEDMQTACKLDDIETVCLAANDLSILSDDQAKKWKAALAKLRVRCAEANEADKTDNGSFKTAGIVPAIFTDETGEEFFGLHIPDAVATVTDEDNDEDGYTDTIGEGSDE